MTRRLTYKDAVALWIARWLGVSQSSLCQRFDVDARRFYEVWSLKRYPDSHAHAKRLFVALFPGRVPETDFREHRRTRRQARPGQFDMFALLEPEN